MGPMPLRPTPKLPGIIMGGLIAGLPRIIGFIMPPRIIGFIIMGGYGIGGGHADGIMPGTGKIYGGYGIIFGTGTGIGGSDILNELPPLLLSGGGPPLIICLALSMMLMVGACCYSAGAGAASPPPPPPSKELAAPANKGKNYTSVWANSRRELSIMSNLTALPIF